MNLELDFKPSKRNPLIEKYSQPPIEFRDNLFVLKNWYFNHLGEHSDRKLCNIDDFFNLVDVKEFARNTSMTQVTSFMEGLESFERRWRRYLSNQTNSEYIFSVTRSFNWKRGIYDAIRDYTDYCQKRHMRNAGIERFFIRLNDARYSVRNFGEEVTRLDNLRKSAKEAAGKVVENLDELVELQQLEMEKIKESTIAANKISPYFDVYNYINFNEMDNETFNGYLDLRLITFVVAKENSMSVVKNNNDIVFKMKVPQAYLVFERKLNKVLTGNIDKNIVFNSSTTGKRHPYISNSPFYDLGHSEYRSDGITTGAWTRSLCLSSYSDDILSSLAKNDYESFVMGLSNWNNIYNIESTNPHNNPKIMFYENGFDEKISEEDIKGIQSWTGHTTTGCFIHHTLMNHDVEDNPKLKVINRKTGSSGNIYDYGDYVLNRCNEIKCQLRDKCNPYNNYNYSKRIPDLEEMIESLTGAEMEFYRLEGLSGWTSNTDIASKFTNHMNHVLDIGDRLDRYITTILSEINYWGTPKPISIEDKVAHWTHSINQRH